MKRVFVLWAATHTRSVVEEPAANQMENPRFQLFLALNSAQRTQLENFAKLFSKRSG